MNSETCLSCEGIERYLGEEEERVHALRGVSLDIESGQCPRGCWAVGMWQKLVALHSWSARSA